MLNLFNQIAPFENLHRSWRQAAKNRRYRLAVLKFGCNITAEQRENRK
jgi:hypothetical protein